MIDRQQLQQQLIGLIQNAYREASGSLNVFRDFIRSPQPDTAHLKRFYAVQTPFYHAVRVFPQMLALGAALVEHTEHRLHIVENLMTEHGLDGNHARPHVATYLDYLNAIGAYLHKKPLAAADIAYYPQYIEPFKSGEGVLPADQTEYLLLLAGIEYIYAVISQDIVNYLKYFGLDTQQQHYSVHAELDWEHGWELVEVYLEQVENGMIGPVSEARLTQLRQPQYICDCVLQGAEHLAKLLAGLMETDNVRDLPTAFYFSREDARVEAQLVQQYFADVRELHLCGIAGGGENYLYLANRFADKDLYVDLLDLNPNQIALVKEKAARTDVCRLRDNQSHSRTFSKFEHLFADLRGYRDFDEGCRQVFGKGNLIRYFGERAVLSNSSPDEYVFAEHFRRALLERPQHWNTQNILHGQAVDIALKQDNLHLRSERVADIAALDFSQWHGLRDSHLIMLSNVFDWLTADEIGGVLTRLQAALRDCGNLQAVAVVRKMLSDYDMAQTAAAHGWQVADDSLRHPQLLDETGFYSATYVLRLETR